MQMYKVKFHTQTEDRAEFGTYLVCARNSEEAEQAVALTANLTQSKATFDTQRVKPSVYELTRRELTRRELTISETGIVSDAKENGAVHEVRSSAKVFANSESVAMRRLAQALIDRASAKNNTTKHVNDFCIEIERADYRPSPSRIDEQSIYKEHRFFAGGAARPR
jgi:hypothetical protein